MSTQPEMKTPPKVNAHIPAAVIRGLAKVPMAIPETNIAKLTHRTLAKLRLKLLAYTPLFRAARQLGIVVATALLVAAPARVLATPLDLSSAPLFVAATVQPNIFFLADDSGSMDWNLMTSESGGQMQLTGCTSRTYSYIFPQADNNYAANSGNGRILPSQEAVDAAGNMPNAAAGNHGVWRARYSGYNKLYYNPDVTYTPWQGVDAAGVAFANATPTAARLNPYVTTGGTNLVDLTANMSWTADEVPKTSSCSPTTTNLNVTNYYPARYYTWTDKAPLNGVVDADDTHTLVEIKPSPTTYPHTLGTRIECGAASSTCTYAQELQNFANWFSYYRRRISASKNAIGKVIAPSSARMGLGTLHNNGTVNTQISLMNASTSAAGNKRTLLNAVYGNSANNGTPLRTKLDEVGKYYECETGNIFGLTAGTSCPILPAAQGGACQKNFTVMMTDGYYNDAFTFSATPNNKDGDGNTTFDGGAYADVWSHTLADIAMHYYERDLSSLPNSVTVAGLDTATHQHMVTYTVAFGVNGTLTANPPNTTAAFAWPDPSLSDANKIDDLRHAAYDSRGLFLNASDPIGLATSLSAALGSIAEQTSSASAVAVNSHTLITNTTVYQARFTSGSWSGDLRALPIAADGSVNTTAPLWSAGDKLKLQNWDTDRHIITHNGTAGVGFRWANLSGSQQASLNDNPSTVSVDDDTFGADRLNWLRGYVTAASPGNTFRTRQNDAGVAYVLGDLVNSAPSYVGAPGVIPDSVESVAHSTFATTWATRANLIYVGGNDGMMHGFDAATGNELLAYVPAAIYPELSKLTDPAYGHRYFVDGSPTTGDAFGAFGATRCAPASSPCWRSVLVSGLGGGGKGIFALDITDPSKFATAEQPANAGNIVLWEVTAAADNDLGYTFSQPSIAKVKIASGSPDTYKWVAIFGNGYNSVNESAALYIVDIVNGTVLRKIVVDQDGGMGTNGNGLSTPVVFDQNNDYIADYVYAGDRKGNLWKFDLTGDQAAWIVANGTSGAPLPLFKAVDSTGVAQPITTRPVVGTHPVSGSIVYVGTGSYITNGDKTPSVNPTHTFYGIWDKGISSLTVPVARADLLPQTITEPSTTSRTITATPITWRVSGSTPCVSDGSGECLGWRVDLPTAGEMSVTNPVLLTTDLVDLPRIIFTTLISEAGICDAGGTGWLMELDPTSGGLLPGAVFDTDGDGDIDASDVPTAGKNPGIGILSQPVVISDPANREIKKIISGSSGSVVSVDQPGLTPPPTGATGRKSWRQLR